MVWLVIAAIINPLCCCLSALHTTEFQETPATGHACCSSNKGEQNKLPTTDNDSDQELSHDVCPHQLEKKTAKMQSNSDHSQPVSPVLGLWLGILRTLPLDTSVATTVRYSFSTHSPPPNALHSQEQLCVYLI